jgi:hypothetical protein
MAFSRIEPAYVCNPTASRNGFFAQWAPGARPKRPHLLYVSSRGDAERGQGFDASICAVAGDCLDPEAWAPASSEALSSRVIGELHRHETAKKKGEEAMIGLFIGAVCAIGLAKMLRRRVWYGRFGYGGHCGGGCRPVGYGYEPRGYRDPADERFDFDEQRGYGMGPMAFRHRGARWVLRSLFERLQTTPGQERVMLEAIDEMRSNRKALLEELRQSRADVARAIEGGLIEDSTLEEAFARQDRLLAQLRVGFVEALRKITEALDESQRKQLARQIEGGLFRSSWRGPGSVWA